MRYPSRLRDMVVGPRGRFALGLLLAAVGAATLALALTARVARAQQGSPGQDATTQATTLSSSRGDFDGDLKSDILWRNVSTTALQIWLMNGTSAPTSGPVVLPIGINPPGVNWKVQAIGDFDLDGKADMLWRNQTSGVSTRWTMNGFTRLTATALAEETDLMWAIRGVADFNGDGKVDILWRNEAAEALRLWLAGGIAGSASTPITITPGLAWAHQGLGDLDGDGKADIIWRHAISGRVVVWLMNGAVRTDGGFLSDPAITQNLVGVGDFNGDGRDDLLWRDELSGAIELWTTAVGGLSTSSVDSAGTLGLGWSTQRIGDYDGDSRSDILWRNSTTGSMVVWLMNGPSHSGASVGTESDANWQVQGGFNWYFGSLAAPIVSPASGTLFVGQLSVSLSAATGATVRYTTDGSEPTATSARYTTAFPLTTSATVKAKAFRQGWDNSPTVTATYTRQPAMPVLTPGSGTYTNQAVVHVTSETGTEVRYTVATAGTPADPTSTSALYAGPLLVDRGATVKARAFHSDWAPSAVASATYAIQLGAPSLSPGSGSYAFDAQITVTAPTPGTILHYTTSGVDPTEADPTICSGCKLRNPATTLKVKAWKPGTTPSPVTSAMYSFSGSGRGDALLVGGFGDDGPTQARLQQLGFNVVAIPWDEVERDDAAGKKIVVISSSTADPEALGDTFKTVTTPVLVWEAKLYDNMGLTATTSNDNFVAGQTKIVLTAGDHPASGGVTGPVTISTTGMTIGWAEPGLRATIVARGSAPGSPIDNMPVIFAYEAGVPLYDGTRADGRRIGFFGVAATMTGGAWAAFDAAVNWATTPFPPALVFLGPTINASDAAVLDRLLYLGYPLQIYTLGAPNTGAPPSQNAIVSGGYKLVVISSTVDHNVYQFDGYLGLPVPIVLWEHQSFSELKMVGTQGFQRGTVGGQHELNILDPTHPLAAGLSGIVDPLSPIDPHYGDPPPNPWPPLPTTGVFAWARPPNGAKLVANLTTDPDGGGLPTGIFSYDKNDPLFGGVPAPARRVGLFLTDNLAASMNEYGWRFFDAAIQWAINRDLDTDGDGLTDLDEIRYGTNPNDADTNDDGISDGAAIHAGISATNLDMDGDGVINLTERQTGTDPFRADTDGDGCIDHPTFDKFPLDPARCLLTPDPTPGVPPVITLIEPPNATLISTVP